jgi:hypothetical protein
MSRKKRKTKRLLGDVEDRIFSISTSVSLNSKLKGTPFSYILLARLFFVMRLTQTSLASGTALKTLINNYNSKLLISCLYP